MNIAKCGPITFQVELRPGYALADDAHILARNGSSKMVVGLCNVMVRLCKITYAKGMGWGLRV